MSTGIGVGVSSVFGGVKASPSFEYSGSAFCANATPDPTPTINGTPSGTFTSAPVSPSTGTLVINASTGTIDLSASDPGNYLVTYTVGGVSESDPFEVLPVQTTSFSYSSNSFQDNGTASPTITGSAGGVFTATTGLIIDANTGVIDLGASTVGGPYTVTYTNTGACQGTPSTFDVSITATVRIIANNFALDFNGTDEYVETSATPAQLGFPATTVSSGGFSISFWYYHNTIVNYDVVLQSTNANADNGFGVWQSTTNNGLNFWVGHYLQGDLYTTNNYFTSQKWYNITCTFQAGSTHTLNIYIDGVINRTVDYTTSRNIHSGENVLIGGWPLYSRYFNGSLDEVAMWNKVISANAVQEIYNATTNNPGFTADLFKLANESQAPVYWNRMGDD
mgnify:FL=1